MLFLKVDTITDRLKIKVKVECRMTERVRLYSVILPIGHVSPMSLMSIVLRYRLLASPRSQVCTLHTCGDMASISGFRGAKQPVQETPSSIWCIF